MKKNLITIIVAVIVIASSFLVTFLNQPKLAYIDTNLLVQNYKGLPEIQAKLEVIEKKIQAENDTLLKSWEREIKQYEKERSKMTAKEKELKEQLLKNKQIQLSRYSESLDEKKNTEQQEVYQKMLDHINGFITDYGKDKKYNIILGANGSGNILYAGKTMDITEKVLELLNEEYKSTGINTATETPNEAKTTQEE